MPASERAELPREEVLSSRIGDTSEAHGESSTMGIAAPQNLQASDLARARKH